MKMVQAVSRYAHTLRHLWPIQIYGRAWRYIYAPRAVLAAAPPARLASAIWQPGPERPRSLADKDSFEFFGERHRLPENAAWDDIRAAKLWLYNLHYFDDLNAVGSQARNELHSALLRRWVFENPPGQGSGWEPYPVSLRLVNWIKWGLRGNDLPAECVHSTAVQGRWLAERVEHHLQGNHLIANAKALIFAGAFFTGQEAEAWLEAGQALLTREMVQQILADGGHVERSPMYHGIILEDLLDLVQLAAVFPGVLDDQLIEIARSKASLMSAWLAGMTHPDGEISFFNDAAIGIAAAPGDLAGYAQALGIPTVLGARAVRGAGGTWFPESGYVRLETQRMVAILDLAPLGPDHLTGHGHADTLAFELSVDGDRVIVNGGTSCYGTSELRQLERGTAAHNTVEIDGEDSSEVWAGFRTARRARIVSPVEVSINHPLIVRAAHDGYRRLSGRPIHEREWRVSPNGLVVADTITGRYRQAIGRVHLHPNVQVASGGEDGAAHRLLLPGGGRMVVRVANAESSIVPSAWHPRFGLTLSSQCVQVARVQPEGPPMQTVIELEPRLA